MYYNNEFKDCLIVRGSILRKMEQTRVMFLRIDIILEREITKDESEKALFSSSHSDWGSFGRRSRDLGSILVCSHFMTTRRGDCCV